MADAGTFVQYGNVRLHRCVTHEFRQEAVFDDSRTDLLYMKHVIRVSGFINGHTDYQWLMQFPYVNDGTGATGAHKLLRFQLPPRLPFKYCAGAQGDGVPSQSGGGQPIVLLDVTPAPTPMIPPPTQYANINLRGIDLNNGPRCTEFAVTGIVGNESFSVTATFEVAVLECVEGGSCPQNTYGVLSNRWSIEDSLDHNMQTTRTYQGLMVLASANIEAHQLRYFCAPPLYPYFRRESMNFVISEDGLRLHWTVVDQEVAASAPYPARSWNVIHTERANGAKIGMSTVQVDLEGGSNVNKGDLIELAIYIICLKIFGRKPQDISRDNSNIFVHSLEITDVTGNRNAVSASAQVSRPVDSTHGWFLTMGQLGKTIVGDNLPAPNDGTQGGLGGQPLVDASGAVLGYQGDTGGGLKYDRALSWGAYVGQTPAVEGPAAVIGIISCWLQTPCTNDHSLVTLAGGTPHGVQSSLGSTQLPAPRIPYTATVGTGVTNATQNPVYSLGQLTAVYTHYQIDNIYRRRSLRVQMPIATIPISQYDATSSFVKLGGDQIVRILRVEASRVGAEPEFFHPESIPAWPAPTPQPTGWKPIEQQYLKHTIRPGHAVQTATGQTVYHATMEVVIGLSRPPTILEKLALGNEKWTNLGNQSTGLGLLGGTW